MCGWWLSTGQEYDAVYHTTLYAMGRTGMIVSSLQLFGQEMKCVSSLLEMSGRKACRQPPPLMAGEKVIPELLTSVYLGEKIRNQQQ